MLSVIVEAYTAYTLATLSYFQEHPIALIAGYGALALLLVILGWTIAWGVRDSKPSNKANTDE